jgi:L-ascorbate metabolism protein UlaG (beta-lactamase superfamily)
MQVSFVGHASILIESKGIRILSDPWWRGPCFGAQWWNYPLPDLAPLEQRVDYIYVSHGHHDHFHPGTLKTLNRDAKVLVSKNIDIGDPIRELGYEVVEIGDDEEHTLGSGIKVRIIETHGADTLLAVSDGDSVCVNLNDALHAAPDEVQERFTALLKSLYPRIDYLFCGYGVASHFPNCYRIPGKDPAATAARRQAYFNRRWVKIASSLSPRFAFPFAADVVFLEEDLMWMNETTQNIERPTDVFQKAHPKSSTTVMDIAPGFQINDGTVTRPIYRQPVSLPQLRLDCADKIVRANEYGTGTDAAFDEVVELIRENVARCAAYLQEYPGDYRFLVKFRNYAEAISIVKSGEVIVVEPNIATEATTFDVTYITRLQYIRWSLSSEYGHEILFVGSGGIFEYAEQAKSKENVHRELMVMLVPHEKPPRSRFGNQPRWKYRLKRAIRNVFGSRTADLYDLSTWTVWEHSPSRP